MKSGQFMDKTNVIWILLYFKRFTNFNGPITVVLAVLLSSKIRACLEEFHWLQAIKEKNKHLHKSEKRYDILKYYLS